MPAQSFKNLIISTVTRNDAPHVYIVIRPTPMNNTPQYSLGEMIEFQNKTYIVTEVIHKMETKVDGTSDTIHIYAQKSE